MRLNLLVTIILPPLISFQTGSPEKVWPRLHNAAEGQKIQNIATPAGYHRIPATLESFPAWLRNIPLKKDNRVFLYNGALKQNQSAQFAVLDIPVGEKDLQQCADAIMRLRAQFLFDKKRFAEISFTDNSGKKYKYLSHRGRSFEHYLETVFAFCGTRSLEKQLKRIADPDSLQPGDVFIQGGFPGHAVIVVDMAVHASGKKVYLLAQSYMPAQDIHILRNPKNREMSPWYELSDNSLIHTPEWTFRPGNLRRWDY